MELIKTTDVIIAEAKDLVGIYGIDEQSIKIFAAHSVGKFFDTVDDIKEINLHEFITGMLDLYVNDEHIFILIDNDKNIRLRIFENQDERYILKRSTESIVRLIETIEAKEQIPKNEEEIIRDLERIIDYIYSI